jgi:hypothetical protein
MEKIRTPASKKMNLFTNRQGALSLVQAHFESFSREAIENGTILLYANAQVTGIFLFSSVSSGFAVSQLDYSNG